MRVRVLFFGLLREVMGTSERVLEVPYGATAGEVLALCEQQQSVGAALWKSVAIAVNQEYSKSSHVLAEGDEVALLPPVSGGA